MNQLALAALSNPATKVAVAEVGAAIAQYGIIGLADHLMDLMAYRVARHIVNLERAEKSRRNV